MIYFDSYFKFAVNHGTLLLHREISESNVENDYFRVHFERSDISEKPESDQICILIWIMKEYLSILAETLAFDI